jgi:GTP pyrophosphokinase
MENKQNRESFVEQFIRPIKKSLDERGMKYTIKGRPKSIYSIYNKIKKADTPFEKIYDLFAIRVVLDVPLEREKGECWEVYSIVTDHYRPNPSRLKDWVSTPKSNGYESLHTTVMSMPFGNDKEGRWVEVQIRTKRMDEIAEKGVAAHFKYKGTDTRTSQAFESWLSQVREALEMNDKSQSAVELVDDIKNSLYHEEVFVFTPKGKLVVLQAGATALDFAFEIHSEVGSHCIGAKVGGKLVPLSHKLSNGDQLEILTSSKQKPSEDWLRIVTTTKAKARIKDCIKEDNKGYLIQGRDVVEARLKHLGYPNLTLELTNQLRAYFNAKDANDLFYRFGKAYISVDQLKHWKADKEMHERKQAEKAIKAPIVDSKSFKKGMQQVEEGRKESDILLIGEDMDKVDYTLAKCCNPISGDEVFGFVTINEGIKIHRTTCPNSPELLSRHGDRVIKAQWTSQIQMSFVVELTIRGIDRVGLVNDVTRVISDELKVNITALAIGVKDGLFEGKISLMIHDTSHLESLAAELEMVAGVIEVARED